MDVPPSGGRGRQRFAVLWPGPSGYLSSCLAELQKLGEVFLASPGAWPHAQFEEDRLATVRHRYRKPLDDPMPDLVPALEEFSPDALLVSSWQIRPYRRALRAFGGHALRVLCMDNVWRGRPKQWLGRAVAPFYVAPLYDCAFVPGERQARFARMLGFNDRQIIRGMLTADSGTFSSRPRRPSDIAGARRFLFAGRLVHSKGADLLGTAYSNYRDSVVDPWPLTVAGAGPEETTLRGLDGVELAGFCQPVELAGLMRSSTVLLLPSRWDPWGVVVHEAACAGMALVCTTAVGAAESLLQDGYNGRLIPPGDSMALTEAMVDITALSHAELAEMSAGSRSLAAQFSPARWARHLAREVDRRHPAVGPKVQEVRDAALSRTQVSALRKSPQ